VDVCEWMGSHCFDVRHTVLEVLHSEVSRSYVVTGDALSATATPLTRSELLALPESVSRRLAVYFVRLVENDLNSSRPPIVYVPSR
jgi:Mg/Co/Ni transporter MgtE